jgi:hypothetical protein
MTDCKMYWCQRYYGNKIPKQSKILVFFLQIAKMNYYFLSTVRYGLRRGTDTYKDIKGGFPIYSTLSEN